MRAFAGYQSLTTCTAERMTHDRARMADRSGGVVTRDLLGWLGGLLFIAALLGGLYGLGQHHGTVAADARWRAGMAEVDAEVARQRADAQARADALAVEIEVLRARPERVRTVTREVLKHVVADTECSSLPAGWRLLWNADGSADGAPADAGSLDAAAVPAVAGARR